MASRKGGHNRLFDTYIMVDWSAAASPRTGRDSIWIAEKRAGSRLRPLANPSTRQDAEALLQDRLADRLKAGDRVLVGFDFPFGYPAGTARRLGLDGPPWRALWSLLAAEIEDSPDNANNRFDVAAALNKRLSGGPFPFWGCPPRAAGPYLTQKRDRRHGEDDIAERRHADGAVPRAQPVWKLYTTGSVGSQVLTGLPVVSRLRSDPRWRQVSAVWPFETGLMSPSPEVHFAFAEIYPSVWCKSAPDGVIKDAAQVSAVVSELAALDRTGRLAELFKGPRHPSAAMARAITTEEAWILGVI